jgi:hypothetical protein
LLGWRPLAPGLPARRLRHIYAPRCRLCPFQSPARLCTAVAPARACRARRRRFGGLLARSASTAGAAAPPGGASRTQRGFARRRLEIVRSG